MKQIQSILLLLIIGITLLPWQLACNAHPFGHTHHKNSGPSACEILRKVIQQPGKHLTPPMDCKNVAAATDTYDQTQVLNIVPTIQLAAVDVVIFDLVGFEIKEQPYIFTPDPNCRSAIIISDSPLRGPPLV